MSMNIYIVAQREISYKKKNGETASDIQQVKFDAVQTPTDVTYEIIESANPADAYFAYVKSCSCPVKEPVYAKNDIFGESDPVGFREYDWTAEHLERFIAWVDEVEEAGYTVKFEVI